MLKRKILSFLLVGALAVGMTAVPAGFDSHESYAAADTQKQQILEEKTINAETFSGSNIKTAASAAQIEAIKNGTASSELSADADDENLVKGLEDVTKSPTQDIIPLEAKKSLSLAKAVEIMTTTGTRAQMAELNKKSDIAVANGYSEKVRSIQKALDKMDASADSTAATVAQFNQLASAAYAGGHFEDYATYKALGGSISTLTWNTISAAQDAGATSTNKKIMRTRRDFANAHMEENYDADINQIKLDTTQVYSMAVLAKENYRIAQENLNAMNKNLKDITAKKNVGVLSKSDVLKAQSAVTEAQSSVRAAKTSMNYALMSFNYLLGYNVMQEVDFTDKLVQTTTVPTDTETAVKNALANRNEIKGADYAVTLYEMLLADVNAYPKSSSTYLTAQYNLLNAQKTAKDARSQIEIDIRNQAAQVADKKAALEAAKSLQSYATEGLRLMKLTNEEGLSTTEQLLETQTSLFKANLNVANATAAYNLAVQTYQTAQGNGCMRIPL